MALQSAGVEAVEFSRMRKRMMMQLDSTGVKRRMT